MCTSMVEYFVIDFQHNSLCPILVNKHNIRHTMYFNSRFCTCIVYIFFFVFLSNFVYQIYIYLFFIYHENPSFFYHEVLYRYLFSFYVKFGLKWSYFKVLRSLIYTLNDKRHKHSIVIKYICMIDA